MVWVRRSAGVRDAISTAQRLGVASATAAGSGSNVAWQNTGSCSGFCFFWSRVTRTPQEFANSGRAKWDGGARKLGVVVPALVQWEVSLQQVRLDGRGRACSAERAFFACVELSTAPHV